MLSKYPSRRQFFKTGIVGGASMFAAGSLFAYPERHDHLRSQKTSYVADVQLPSPYALDLSPAKWIWYPAERTLQNTFILFRKSINISTELQSASGWILGDSRYLLEVNGQRIQWGPAPADPRFSEADPIELKTYLRRGINVLGTTVLYYGQGDGTWPLGKPGFIFYLELVYASGAKERIISDHTWNCHLARSWKPGQFKRWYLRALQEEFDARKYPYGWTNHSFKMDSNWVQAHELSGKPDQPALAASGTDYLFNSSLAFDAQTELRKRMIPMVLEKEGPTPVLEETYRVKWIRPVEEYFEMCSYNAVEFSEYFTPTIHSEQETGFEHLGFDSGTVLTYSFPEQVVGWPGFEIIATGGTMIELMVQEGHQLTRVGGPPIMNNHFNSWTKFICNEGENRFQCFDYESIKWLQFHIHGEAGKITIKKVWVSRRIYDWPHPPKIKVSDQKLQKLIHASINTIYNNALDTIMDGVGRERQQYSGDIGHELHALYRVFGENQLPARYVNTFSQGMTKDGFFLDTWPAYDRLNRLAQRQLDLTPWGPLLDHSVAFVFDCYYHYLYTGHLTDLQEVAPRLIRFYHYLKSILNDQGLLPVEQLGIPTVWMDTDAYQHQKHKQCAFNLYSVAMLAYAFAPLATAFGKEMLAKEAVELSKKILESTTANFWDPFAKLFVCNLPWLKEEGAPRLCERSLSKAILFNLCPNFNIKASVDALQDIPENLGRCYPANGNWHLWALGKTGKIDSIFNDLHSRWIDMGSVDQNNTMQEAWQAAPDSNAQWSHAAIAPLFVPYMILAGIEPLEPGYNRFQIWPQPGPIQSLDLINHTVKGPIHFRLQGLKGHRQLNLRFPDSGEGILILLEKEKIDLPKSRLKVHTGFTAYSLKEKTSFNCILKYT